MLCANKHDRLRSIRHNILQNANQCRIAFIGTHMNEFQLQLVGQFGFDVWKIDFNLLIFQLVALVGWLRYSPSRMRIGSLRPALAKSTKTFGRVALNMTICLLSGNRLSVSFNCSPKPISNKRSASSNTTYSVQTNRRN